MSLFLSTAFSDNLIPKWMCLATAWFILVTALSKREYPLWLEAIIVVHFVVFVYFVVQLP